YAHALGSRLAEKKNSYQKGIPQSWGVPVDSEGMTGLLYFHPEVQRAYKTWVRELLTRENPYTGVPLKDEPAMAIFQMQNEDSLLFWTLSQIKGEEARLLSKAFGDFAAEKYGSIPKAYEAWDGAIPRDAVGGVEDDRNTGVLGVTGIWYMTQKQNPASGFGRRLADQSEFLATTMFDVHAEMARFVEEDLGCPVLFNAGNWRTADDLLLDDLERWSYTAGDVIGINRYTTAKHEGEHTGWAVTNGQVFTNESTLYKPERISVGLKQPVGHPYIISEALWVPPNLYQSEAALVTSIYQCLNGVDAAYWFAIGRTDPQFRQPSSANGYLPSLGKFTVPTPMTLGMFPAAAVLFREGLIEEADPVVTEYRPLDAVWNRRVPAISSEAAYDPNRDSAPKDSLAATKVDRKAFLAGPVRVRYEDGQTTSVEPETPWNIAVQAGDQVSGGVQWSAGGVAAFSPRVAVLSVLDHAHAEQMLEAFETSTPTAADPVQIACENTYATVAVVSLDGQPLSESEKTLVQVGTSARSTNWATEPSETIAPSGNEYTITNFGEAPWQIVEADVRFKIANPNITAIRKLDANGMDQGEVAFERDGNVLSFTMPADCLYVMLLGDAVDQ
ncbi:MAG: hypothetical protein AAGK78_03610, partial [Planctomycetota bacterium]